MSSPPWSALETQASTPGVALQQQASESPIGGIPTNSSNPVSASSTSVSPGCGSAAEAGMPTTSPSRAGNGISIAVTGSVTPAAGPSTPTGVPHGFVVPASSFSYGVLPPPNSVSGSSQQSSNNPVLKLTPSVSAAALQPPVPGQSFGNRPSFSYNIVSQANVGSGIGQQFQPAIGGKFTAAMTAASLQPPVPGQLMRPSVSSVVAHGGTIPFDSSSSDIGGNSGSALLHPEHERQGSEPSKGGVPKNEEIDAWTGSKFYGKNTTHLGFPTSSLSSMGNYFLVVAVIISLVLLVVGLLTPETNTISGRVLMIISCLIMDCVIVFNGKKAQR